MVLDVAISDTLSIAQTVGIIGTLLIALFLSRREVKDLSIDIETKACIPAIPACYNLARGGTLI
jgi:hypothetical protein